MTEEKILNAVDDMLATSCRECGFARGMGASIHVLRVLGNREAADLLTGILCGDDFKRLAACGIEEREPILDRYLQFNAAKGAA